MSREPESMPETTFESSRDSASASAAPERAESMPAEPERAESKGGMTRRQALKTMALGGFGAGAVLTAGCAPDHTAADAAEGASHAGHAHVRQPGAIDDPLRAAPGEEALRNWKPAFLDEHEFETVRQLANHILPADDRSGNAEQANVPNFIDFTLTENPQDQTLMRGGLRWLDRTCRRDYGGAFIRLSEADQRAMLDRLAWPEQVAPGDEPGERLFNLVRNYTSTGFWSSKMGMADIGYIGNVPYVWEGPPESELRRLGLLDG